MFTIQKNLVRNINTFEKIKYVFNSYISKPNIIPAKIQSYVSASDNKKQRLLRHIEQKEPFKIRQDILSNEFLNNVAYDESSEDKMKIIDLVWKYEISPLDILCAMYVADKNASLQEGKFASNPFNLPEFREISQVTHDNNIDTDWYKFERNLRNEYKKNIHNDMKNGIYRIYMGDNTRYIILRQAINYDFSVLKAKIIPHDKPNDNLQTIILGETKDPMRNYDKNVFKGILEIAGKNKGYIGKIGNVSIQMIFDSIEFYDATQYNQNNGQDAFDHILIDIVGQRIVYSGESSIVNQYTFDLISKKLTEVIVQHMLSDNISLRDRLYDNMISLTTHYANDDLIQIGRLMDEYDIEGSELFLEMFKMKNPTGYSWNEYNDNKEQADNLSLSDSIKILESNNYSIYKLYGKYIDNRFRRERYHNQNIKIRSYDYGDNGLFYKCLFNLMIKNTNI
jgi:hypothetical protein